MKHFRVHVLFLAALAIMMSNAAFSQTASCPLSPESGLTPVDTLQVSVYVSGGTATSSGDKKGGTTGKGKRATGDINFDVVVLNSDPGTGGSGPVYSISPSTIQYTGDASIVDGMSTKAVFDLMSQTAISQLVAQGQISCSPTCPGPVWRLCVPACVQRVGSGSATQFLDCDPGSCCIRYYTVCCPNGPSAPVIQMVMSESAGCIDQGSCESTCP
jgi:hypothetical protein